MSGICGILRLDPALPAGIDAMADELQARGPEATRLFRDGPCALGHTLLATTPEAEHEVLPLTHRETGCTLTADLRIDNRAELISALGLRDQKPAPGDGELVLQAYLRWGEDCPQRLLGDFAFAIWDPRHQRLFCARDPMGMKPLNWVHVPGRLVAFASTPAAVLLAEGVRKRINEGRIADFLDGYLEAIDLTSTFFEGVERLPPAHWLAVDARGARATRYWRLEPGRILRLESNAAYEEAFREVFTTAVHDRLRAPAGTVGSTLSGGMDSGALVAVAARHFAEVGRGPFPTFSSVGPDPAHCVETRAIQAAMTMPNLAPHCVSFADLDGDAEELIALTRNLDEPFDGQMTVLRALYASARRSGMKVLCDGAGGDLVFTNGAHLPRLLRRGRWRKAWTEAQQQYARWELPAPGALFWLKQLRQAFTPGWVRQARRSARRWHGRIDPRGYCQPEFARRIQLAERQARERDSYLLAWRPLPEARAHILQQGYLTAGRERYDRIAAASGIEPRDPYLDLRVLAFCLALPQEQLSDGGWTKILQRRAMAGRLPDTVRWRRGKEHLGWAFTEHLLQAWPEARSPALLATVADYARMPATQPGTPAVAPATEAVAPAFLALWYAKHGP